jgi:hypothetical protein
VVFRVIVAEGGQYEVDSGSNAGFEQRAGLCSGHEREAHEADGLHFGLQVRRDAQQLSAGCGLREEVHLGGRKAGLCRRREEGSLGHRQPGRDRERLWQEGDLVGEGGRQRQDHSHHQGPVGEGREGFERNDGRHEALKQVSETGCTKGRITASFRASIRRIGRQSDSVRAIC